MYQSLAQASEALKGSTVGENIKPSMRSHIVSEMFNRKLSPQAMYNEFKTYDVWVKSGEDE